MAEKKPTEKKPTEKKPTSRKKKAETPVEETAAAVETTEAATPAVDEGAPMASTDAMQDPVAEVEAVDPGTAEDDAAPQPEPAEDDIAPLVVEAEEKAPAAEEPAAAAEVAAQTEPELAPEVEAAPDQTVAEEPVAEEPVADEPVAEAPAAAPAAEPVPPQPQPQSGPKPKRKRLPRALRPSTSKGRVKREKATERKPIIRIPKPEGEFGRRQERQGTVVSDKGDKTIVVKVDTIKAHPRYKKVVRRSKRFHAHDEQNAAKIGDVVKIIETRPISKTKNWRLAEILEVAK